MDHIDLYEMEASSFEADVNLLIRNTLHAALAHLSGRADKDLADIKKALDKATHDEVQNYLVEEHVDVLATGLAQERFLRNMALVALASLLTHALRKIARDAEHFVPRKKKYGTTSDSEFERLWKEYADRFGIDFTTNSSRIAFVEPMRKVRNRIVHEGAAANGWNEDTLPSLQRGEEPTLDTKFSKAYPDFVRGEGWDAEVVVSQEQLDSMCDASVALVQWLATELDTKDGAAGN